MTREELVIQKKKNIHERGIRAEETARLFLEHNGNISDIDLAKKLNEKGIKTSSSSVGRDLSKNLEDYYLYINRENKIIKQDENYLTDEQQKTIDFIRKKRKENLYKAKVTGGTVSAERNQYIKGSDSKFKGCKKNV